MLTLFMRFIYVDHHQFMEHDSKHILGHEYKRYSIFFPFIEENSENQCEYIG